MLKKAFVIDNDKIDIWIQAILSCPFDTTFYVGEKLLFSKNGKRKIVRALAYETDKPEQLSFIERLVSELCYTHGMIKNLSRRDGHNVRENDQKISG